MEQKTPKSPWELFGVECYEGWRSLIEPLFKYIIDYNEGKPEEEQIVIAQVKEKFGGLRFYVHNSTPELDKMISKAEAKSYEVCEKCGSRRNVGMLDAYGWYYTRCKKCAQKEVDRLGVEGTFTLHLKPKKKRK